MTSLGASLLYNNHTERTVYFEITVIYAPKKKYNSLKYEYKKYVYSIFFSSNVRKFQQLAICDKLSTL